MLHPLEQAELEQLRGVVASGKVLAVLLLASIAGLVALAWFTPPARPPLLLGAAVELIVSARVLRHLGRCIRRRRHLEGFTSWPS